MTDDRSDGIVIAWTATLALLVISGATAWAMLKDLLDRSFAIR